MSRQDRYPNKYNGRPYRLFTIDGTAWDTKHPGDVAGPREKMVAEEEYMELLRDIHELSELFHMELMEKNIWDNTHLNHALRLINKYRL